MPDEYYLHYVALMRLLSHVSQYFMITQTVLYVIIEDLYTFTDF